MGGGGGGWGGLCTAFRVITVAKLYILSGHVRSCTVVPSQGVRVAL